MESGQQQNAQQGRDGQRVEAFVAVRSTARRFDHTVGQYDHGHRTEFQRFVEGRNRGHDVSEKYVPKTK